MRIDGPAVEEASVTYYPVVAVKQKDDQPAPDAPLGNFYLKPQEGQNFSGEGFSNLKIIPLAMKYGRDRGYQQNCRSDDGLVPTEASTDKRADACAEVEDGRMVLKCRDASRGECKQYYFMHAYDLERQQIIRIQLKGMSYWAGKQIADFAKEKEGFCEVTLSTARGTKGMAKNYFRILAEVQGTDDDYSAQLQEVEDYLDSFNNKADDSDVPY